MGTMSPRSLQMRCSSSVTLGAWGENAGASRDSLGVRFLVADCSSGRVRLPGSSWPTEGGGRALWPITGHQLRVPPQMPCRANGALGSIPEADGF